MLPNVIKEDILNYIIPEFENELLNFEGKTILITGANGFVPSYLVDTIHLFNQRLTNPIKMILINKNQVTINSRLSHLLDNKNVTFVVADVGKHFEIPFKPNIIIHAASRANPKSFLSNPIDTIDTNINGIRTLLNYAKSNPIEQFIFFSSAEIYGNPLPEFIPTLETYNGNVDCLSPYACYIESKRAAETMAMSFFRVYNIPIKILRILLVYGPGIRNDGKVVSDFFDSAITNNIIKIRDNGESKRSFCYISEAIRQMLKVIFYGEIGEAYNIADDTNNISIRELAFMIAEIRDNNIKVIFNESFSKKEIYGIDNRFASIDKVKKLGIEIKISLREGLKRLNKYYEETGDLNNEK